MFMNPSLDQTFPDTCKVMQDVERECAAACASLAMPMPLNVPLRGLTRAETAILA